MPISVVFSGPFDGIASPEDEALPGAALTANTSVFIFCSGVHPDLFLLDRSGSFFFLLSIHAQTGRMIILRPDFAVMYGNWLFLDVENLVWYSLITGLSQSAEKF